MSAIASAQHYPLEEKNGWFGSLQAGYLWAFGDDSWNIKNDWKEAKAATASLSIGKSFSRLFGARVKARYLELKNRVNLEVYEAFKEKYPNYFPNKGFYSYKGAALQIEGMFNLTNLLPNRSWDFFNVYLLAGGGANVTFSYDKTVIGNWDGSPPGLKFDVDTKTHIIPLGVIGGILDFRVDHDLSLNIELLGTFTSDMMEGIKYEESYDVYITACIGATVYL